MKPLSMVVVQFQSAHERQGIGSAWIRTMNRGIILRIQHQGRADRGYDWYAGL